MSLLREWHPGGILAGMKIWILSDGKPGHLGQTRGLAGALSALNPSAVVQEVDLKGLGFWTKLGVVRFLRKRPSPPLRGDWFIAAGHGTHVPLLYAGRLFHAHTALCMRPSFPTSWFDICFVPRHDLSPAELKRTPSHIFPTYGAMNGLRPAQGGDTNRTLFLIGGPSKEYGWDSAGVLDQIAEVASRAPGHCILTTSRRTPPGVAAEIARRCPDVEVVPCEDTPRGWVAEQLALAGAAWVGQDSVSMIYEALSAGLPVGIIEMKRKSAAPSRVAHGVDMLVSESRVTLFSDWRNTGRLSRSAPLQEADRAARYLLGRFPTVM